MHNLWCSLGLLGLDAEVLERIATALEKLAGIHRGGDPAPTRSRDSAVAYYDELEAVKRELRAEEYYQQTGKRLADDEDPPLMEWEKAVEKRFGGPR